MSLLLRLVALVLFLAAAVIVYSWFGVHAAPDPGGLVALGLAAFAASFLPWPNYFR